MLAKAAYTAGKPLTVYARELIIKQINPLLGGGVSNADEDVESS